MGTKQEVQRTPHPHAQVIKAWADGEDIQFYHKRTAKWLDAATPQWNSDLKYRIKPKVHVHQDLIDKYKLGAKIQCFDPSYGQWCDCVSEPLWTETLEYRIKPKANYFKTVGLYKSVNYNYHKFGKIDTTDFLPKEIEDEWDLINSLELEFSGETDKLVKIQVLTYN